MHSYFQLQLDINMQLIRKPMSIMFKIKFTIIADQIPDIFMNVTGNQHKTTKADPAPAHRARAPPPPFKNF